MLTNVDASTFLQSDEVNLLPIVSAEWNQNLFNPPYVTVAGNGIKESISTISDTNVTDSHKHPNFETHKFALSNNSGSTFFTCTTSTISAAYKIITYVKTDNPTPIMLSAYANGTSTQYGSTSLEINSYGWTKVEVMMGGSSNTDYISNITFNMAVNTFTNYPTTASIYYTKPEIYANQYFNYQYNSVWPSDSPFAYFRPGESYVHTGNSNITFPNNFRQVTSAAKGSFTGSIYAPVSSIVQNPQYLFVTQYAPFLKNVLPTDISTYKYFVSDSTEPSSISAMYSTNISTNKIVLKFNTLVTTPNISVYLNQNPTATYTGSVPSNGVLVLYYNNNAWSTSQWSSMPAFNDLGTLSNYTTINQITVTQNSHTVNSAFPSTASKTSTDYSTDMVRMQLIEVSPRLEIDLSSYVTDLSITKQLDSKSTVVPLSTINTDDATINLSGIPIFTGANPIPLFSNQSNSNSSILANMLRKNIKFYLNWNLVSYSPIGSTNYSNSYIPAGVFYSDSWDETDIESVKITCYDVIRYLQTLPVPDTVSNYKTVFDIISTMLDRAGFTDYDIDSLYTVTNDPSAPMDMSYFYANSQDVTIASALTELFLAYQIGAYIDEYGVMRFLSLANILASSAKSAVMSITDSNIYQGGYSVQNIGKVGKISLRYQEPKIKQTLALQNTDPTIKNSPSFIYTTSTEQPWISQTTDAVGFNYLSTTMNANDNYFSYNVNDLLDIFHTFNLSNNGYAAIENEIVSFVYKEYTLSAPNATTKTVSIKNDIELQSEVDRFARSNTSAVLTVTTGNETSIPSPTNITITPTGRITNVQRGLFGTVPTQHNIITTFASKSLSQATMNGGSISAGGSTASVSNYQPISTNPALSVISCTPPAGQKTLIYPSSQLDQGFHTYSTKFNITDSLNLFAGGIFFNVPSTSSSEGGYFVEFVRNYVGDINTTVGYDPSTGNPINNTTPGYQYLMIVYKIVNGQQSIISWSDITGMTENIVNNFEEVLIKQSSSSQYSYLPSKDAVFQLKVVHYTSDGTDGEQAGQIINVFLNNAQVVGWQSPDNNTTDLSNGWKPSPTNIVTGIPQLPLIGSATSGYNNTQFGAYVSTTPASIIIKQYNSDGTVHASTPMPYNQGNSISSATLAGYIREIYATQAILKDRSTNYWHQSQKFLNGLIQKQNIFNQYKSYMMQTTPTIIGINTYDVQYQSPAATNVDILPIQYYQAYFPSGAPADNGYKQEMFVDEYSLSYSVPLNTGFRAKFAIMNNSQFMVWIHKTPDQLNQTSTQLVLWTHEAVAPSDPSIIERVLNVNNLTEVAQVDSTWIQSSYAANKMIEIVANAIEGFSKDTTIKIFGNPIVQLGDIISVSYSLTGLNNIPFVVQSVKHTFKDGLETELVLNAVGPGTQY